MKLSSIIFFGFIMFGSFIQLKAQNKDSIASKDTTEVNKNSPPDYNTAYQAGEYLKYDVSYGFISGGQAEMTVAVEQLGYDWYYHTKAIATTEGITAKMFTVWDRYESYIDIVTGLPIMAIRDIREENYRKYNEAVFNRNDNIVMSLASGQRKVPPGTQDILSAFYYARRYIFNKELVKGEVINLTTFFDDEIFIIKIKFTKKEIYKTEFGKFECLRFAPVIEPGGPFEKENDMQVWFTNDGNFIPVRIKLSLPVGSVKCDLTGYKNLKNEFGIVKKREIIEEEEK